MISGVKQEPLKLGAGDPVDNGQRASYGMLIKKRAILFEDDVEMTGIGRIIYYLEQSANSGKFLAVYEGDIYCG